MNNIISVCLLLALITLFGSLLRYIFPILYVEKARKYLNFLVLYFFLPIIVFQTIYTASWKEELFKVPLVIGSGIVCSLIFSMFCVRYINNNSFTSKIDFRQSGALLLASSFGSVIYFGLPILQVVFPDLEDTTKIVVLAGVTTTPSCLFIGSLFSSLSNPNNFSYFTIIRPVLELPYFWSISIALLFKKFHLSVPSFLIHLPSSLTTVVSVLMMLSLGMSLRYNFTKLHILIISAFIKLIFSPLIVFILAHLWELKYPYLQATILEAAMPTLVLAIVAAERFNFDRQLLAQCIYFDTLASFFTIPIIYLVLFGYLAIP